MKSYSGRVQEQNYGAENMFAFKYRLCLKNKKKQINYFGFSELLNHQGFKQKKNIIHRLFNNNNNHNLFSPNSDITLDSQNPLLWLQSLW